MKFNQRFFVLALVMGLASATAQAGLFTIVAPNVNATVVGNSQQFLVFDSGAATFQWAYSASEFNPPGPAIPIGSEITSIGFRLPTNASTVTSPIIYTEFDIELSTPAFAIPSLTSNFANNQGGDVVLVRSGPLIIPGSCFIGGPGPNPFCEIGFTTPFIYQGTDLLFTILHSDPTVGPGVDANTLASQPPGLTNTVGALSNTAATGTVNFFNSPVTQLDFNGVPEPTTLALLGVGLAGFAASRRRKLN